MAVDRVHRRPELRPGGDLVSEAGTQLGIARIRAGASSGRRPSVDETSVRAALADVMDPELPMLSVTDLGIVHRVAVSPGSGPIEVDILPTFVGCPALEMIRASIADRLAAFGRPVTVSVTFEVPWTSDRISPTGRDALVAAGIAPPGGDVLIDVERPVACPHCGSGRTRLDNLFGPTQCRTIRYCLDCRQPFESIKPV
jgi:ring-1,2-phenylacetyl-CoA epoxidase subunit PaaD